MEPAGAFRSVTHQRRPSPLLWRVGFHHDISRPARCSLALQPARTADPLKGPFPGELQPIRHLLGRPRRFRLERRHRPGLSPGGPRHLVQGIHNNQIENAIRPTALGKKNWLFFGEAGAGERGAILYTVIESCRRRGIDPYAYLKDVLTRLPSMTNRQLVVLLPANWGRMHTPALRAAA